MKISYVPGLIKAKYVIDIVGLRVSEFGVDNSEAVLSKT